MSTPHQYHQPNAPDPAGDDTDDDLDLDLELAGLAPHSSTSNHHSSSPFHSRNSSSNTHDFGRHRHIPLRNLRAGRLRSRPRNEDEDLEELLHNGPGEANRESSGSVDSTHDGAPLLHSNGATTGKRSGRRRPRPTTTLSKLSSTLRLPSFRSSSSPLDNSHAEDEGDEEPEDDHDPSSNRSIAVGSRQPTRFPPNAISNAKYTPWSFVPRTLYGEFKFFLNMYFLLVALSQIIPALRIGYLTTYIAPLAFVLAVTLGKEAMDDIARRRRDAEANSEGYTVVVFEDVNGGVKGARGGKKRRRNGSAVLNGDAGHVKYREVPRPSKDIKVGDVIRLDKNQRVPADVVILKSISNDVSTVEMVHQPLETVVEESLIETEGPTPSIPAPVTAPTESESSGEAFIRTDQLDGETDWKLRIPCQLSQSLDISGFTNLKVTAGKPDRKVNEFVGMLELVEPTSPGDEAPPSPKRAPLSIDNTAWANTVLASTSTVYAVVIYTGSQTRQALSTSSSRSKVGLLELEINSLTKILCALTFSLSLILVLIGRTQHQEVRKWYISVMRFLILFSTVVPISLRVNLDMGKTVYAWFIEHDKGIPGTVVRTSTIPEDLGRVEYLLSDKTGTLTQNEMELKKIHVGTVSYANEAMDEVSSYINQAFSPQSDSPNSSTLITPSTPFTTTGGTNTATRTRREIGSRVRDLVLALALCHNVTPTTEEIDGQSTVTYQASSPDEIAIVRWTEAIGLRLLQRDRHSIVLQSTKTGKTVVRVRIHNVFPFTSEGKRMGIIVQFLTGETDTEKEGEIYFYQKGADTVMSTIVSTNDWLDEETANMAREGLRTLVIGRKKLSQSQYSEFTTRYSNASLSLQGRDTAMQEVISSHLENGLELLGITGVEDKLQRDVKPSLELLRNAGIKIWMLTGDKVETARCVAVSSKLVARGQYIHTIAKVKRKDLALDSLQFLRSKLDACLLIDGESLALMLQYHRDEFISIAVKLPTVVACRCTPTQKADVAKLIRAYTKKRICCIGDGGNDVSMIQAADVGVGIVGKEGRQASLAADFSIEQFCYLTKLLVWHGRNSYKRSAKLGQFVIHRGLIISVCQTMFSIAGGFEPNALYRDWLLVGYATIYTLAPVFSLVLDRDVDESLANLYPELYAELTTNRTLSYRTFFIWVAISIYQGCIIQGLSQLLVGVGRAPQTPSQGVGANIPPTPNEIATFKKMVALSYTVLILNELGMVCAEIVTWHPIMIFSILGTGLAFFGSLPFLGGYVDLGFVISVGFLWRVGFVLAVALGPPWVVRVVGRRLRPPSYRKVRGV
ncbi:phospholipid-translocating P-type ATPase-like protein [Tothia fuscella]|uniref:Phospholipid-transporting ATPase n=1 Tax=Tothia fuscella TaxID=1048955 RepID=A0A9P4TX34_9PEZI|nr:phospholipid-translocating P-type ATPase-like protein [Tothia fuscella]